MTWALVYALLERSDDCKQDLDEALMPDLLKMDLDRWFLGFFKHPLLLWTALRWL